MIYVLKTDGAPETFYKIGYTKKPINNRIKSLQTGCPYKLELVKTLVGSPDREKEIHALLHESRHHGEWFKDDFLVRETLGIYDFKGFPHSEFIPTPDQEKVMDFFKSSNSCEFWPFGVFLGIVGVSEEAIRRIPYKERGFSISLLTHETMASIGTYHGTPFKHQKLLCIGRV